MNGFLTYPNMTDVSDMQDEVFIYILCFMLSMHLTFHTLAYDNFLSFFLQALKEVTNMDITIFMNCQDKLSEMPLKR